MIMFLNLHNNYFIIAQNKKKLKENFMLITIIIITYTLAISVYGFIITKIQKKERTSGIIVGGQKTEYVKKIDIEDKKENPPNSNLNDISSTNVKALTIIEKENNEKKSENLEKKDKKESFFQKAKSSLSSSEGKPVSDFKLILTAILGGGLGVLIAMATSRYRYKSLPLMVIIPVLTSISIYFLILALRGFYIV